MTDLPTRDELRRLAAIAGVHATSLYQALADKGRTFGPAECVRIETATEGAVRRWDLRPADWHLIWPELIGADGAPATPEKVGA